MFYCVFAIYADKHQRQIRLYFLAVLGRDLIDYLLPVVIHPIVQTAAVIAGPLRIL
jgi:hypothetical protein